MNITEVKHEFEGDKSLQCRACLSVGRKLTPLGRYTNIFMKLTAEFHYNLIAAYPIEICWECLSVLRKVTLFQEQVKKAHELLLIGQSFFYGPLSNLTSVTLNNTQHTIYLSNVTIQNNPNLSDQINVSRNCVQEPINENKIKKDCTTKKYIVRTKQDEKKKYDKGYKKETQSNFNSENQSTNFNSNGNIQSQTEERDRCNAVSVSNEFNNIACKNKNCKQVVHSANEVLALNENSDDEMENSYNIEKEKSNKAKNMTKSRWALKRAKQNKKPKFKIISANLDETFTKFQISNEELAKCLERERDSEYYKSRRFKCEMCVSTFTVENDLIKHNLVHSKILGRYTCDICKTTMEAKRHLSAHITQHYIVHKCTLCQFVCTSREQRLWHLQREHKKMFQCLKCELKFGSRRDFFKHFKEWHEKFICDHCGISFKMRYCIKDHIRKQHSPFKCVPCNKTFARYNGLWLHKKLAHSPATSPAYCVECDISYKDIYRYKWHLCNSARHKPKKKLRVPCPECEKIFTKKIYMRDHYNLVHLKLYRYRCDQCDKNFIRNAELVKHRLRKHEGVLPPRNKICYLCGRGFTTNKILFNHIRTHAGQRRQAVTGEANSIQNYQ